MKAISLGLGGRLWLYGHWMIHVVLYEIVGFSFCFLSALRYRMCKIVWKCSLWRLLGARFEMISNYTWMVKALLAWRSVKNETSRSLHGRKGDCHCDKWNERSSEDREHADGLFDFLSYDSAGSEFDSSSELDDKTLATLAWERKIVSIPLCI